MAGTSPAMTNETLSFFFWRQVFGVIWPSTLGMVASIRDVLPVNERRILQVDLAEFVLLGPVVLVVLPFRLVAALR